MKKSIFLTALGLGLILFAFNLKVSGQNSFSLKGVRPDARLYQALPKDYVDNLVNNPSLLLYYNYYLENSYFISEPSGKPSQGTDIFTVACMTPSGIPSAKLFDEDLSRFDPKKFNPLKYNFTLDPEHYTHYIMGNTGKVMVFYSHKVFAERFNAYLKSFNPDPEK